MNNDNINWIANGPAAIAWLIIIIILLAIAVVGIKYGQESAATTSLAIISSGIGLTAALVTLSGKKKTGGLLAATATLSAAAALLVRETDTLQRIIAKLDLETAILLLSLTTVGILTFVILKSNSEDDEPGNLHGQTPSGKEG